ncbi:nitroreductase [Thermobacillus sp. ZCTH02-B1]|uniref:nitroreductase family protein n=1 Tax=Thermobacillus sp. ZCTH02-B1 TaxID=1858795 RepID=UPI0025D11742|nr:nitroreductase [Thermobacillus sp. ZCTH02-B1]
MDVLEAIRTRRSIGRVSREPVPRETIEAILEAANWAPSHYGTEPWRFRVMTGDGRGVLAKAYGDIAALEAPEEKREEARAKAEAKAYRAPVVIAVSALPSDAPKVVRAEELAATHAAVQNLLLAAHALGLAAIWRTGGPMYHPLMKQALGLAENEELVALVYLGKPEGPPPEGRRRPVSGKTIWMT